MLSCVQLGAGRKVPQISGRPSHDRPHQGDDPATPPPGRERSVATLLSCGALITAAWWVFAGWDWEGAWMLFMPTAGIFLGASVLAFPLLQLGFTRLLGGSSRDAKR